VAILMLGSSIHRQENTMFRIARTFWGLVAVAAATAVGITTHEPGFIVITFLGTLVLPRVLGLSGRRGWRSRALWAGRCGSWDKDQSVAA
jgi:hypothetical protein